MPKDTDKNINKKPYDRVKNIFETLEGNQSGHNIPGTFHHQGDVSTSYTDPEIIKKLFANAVDETPVAENSKTGINLPGHKFLGPGNSLNGIPIDTDDSIAQRHDIEYNNAKNKVDIFTADNKAIEDFAKDFYETGNVHSALGASGLFVKNVVEEKLLNKVIYPQIEKKKFSLKEFLKTPYNKDKPFGDWNVSSINAAINRAASNHIRGKKYKDLSTEEKKFYSDQYIRDIHKQLESKFGQQEYAKIYYDRSKNFPNEQNLFTLGHSDPVYSLEELEASTDNPQIEEPPMTLPEEPVAKKAKVVKDQQIVPPTEHSNISAERIDEPELNSQIKDTVNPSVDAVKVGSMQSSGGSGIAASKLQYYTGAKFNHVGDTITYKNGFRLRSWGNVWKTFDGANGSGKFRVTGLVALPVNYLGFYIPYALGDELPFGTTVQHVKCKVTPIGQQVSFDTNASTNQSATIGHTLYGYSNIGLNTSYPTGLFSITRNATSKMEVDSVTHVIGANGWETFMNRIHQNSNSTLWDTGEMNNIINPNLYMGIGYMEGVSDATSVETTFLGNYALSNVLAPFPLQPHTGTPCINFEKDTGGLCIARNKAYRIVKEGPRNRTAGTTFCTVTEGYNQELLGWIAEDPNKMKSYKDDSTETIHEPSYYDGDYNTANYGKIRFDRKNIRSFNINGPNSNGQAWPSVCFGVEAVTSNVPESAPSYVNASCDWFIETEILFKINVKFIASLNNKLCRYFQTNNFGFQKVFSSSSEVGDIPMYGYNTNIFIPPTEAIMEREEENETDYELVSSEKSSLYGINKKMRKLF